MPADVRLLATEGLECDESVLTGESLSADKQVEPVERPESPLDLPMGTVVRAGGGRGVVVQTGSRTVFGRIALQLDRHQPQTAIVDENVSVITAVAELMLCSSRHAPKLAIRPAGADQLGA